MNSDFDKLWNYDEPATTEHAFRAVLPELTDRSRIAELNTQIARTLGLQRKFEDAHALLDDVERELAESTCVVRVRYLLERGRVFNSSGKPDRARPLFLQAVDVGTAAGSVDGYVVDALHMLAIVEPEATAQHEWNFRAMRLAESSPDPAAKRWLATLYNNVGWTYYDQKRYDDALEVFRKAIPLREQAGKRVPLRIARYSVGRTLRAMGRYDEALTIQLLQQQDAARDNAPDGYICEEIGECLLSMGREDEARPQLARAYELLSKDAWLAEREPARLERLRSLSGSDEPKDAR